MIKFSRVKVLALVSLSSIVLLASVAFAQTATTSQDNKEKARSEWGGRGKGRGHRGHRDGMGGFRGGAMFRQLNLTEDQKTRMKQVRESFGERTKSLRHTASGEPPGVASGQHRRYVQRSTGYAEAD